MAQLLFETRYGLRVCAGVLLQLTDKYLEQFLFCLLADLIVDRGEHSSSLTRGSRSQLSFLKLTFPFSSNVITCYQVFKFAMLSRVFQQWIRVNVLKVSLDRWPCLLFLYLLIYYGNLQVMNASVRVL